jgi:hypothetical protein
MTAWTSGGSSLLALLMMASALGGCRQTGDFGRAEPNVINDSLLPTLGSAVAEYGREEQVSHFNQTDREKLLRDRAWALVMPAHVGDWIAETAIELQRTRILPAMDSRFDPRAYYAFLRNERFRSSETRWQRLITDMTTDRMLVGPFWDVARAQAEDDRVRLQALDARHQGTAVELKNAYARIDENARVVDWTWRSLRLRVAAYRNAIERMAVETPSRLRIDAELALRDLEQAIAAAETGGMTPRMAQGTRPGRVLKPHVPDEPVPQK